MLNELKNRLTQRWSLMRVIRLVLAIILIVQAITGFEIMFAVLGSFLLFQAVFNYGCCGEAGCDIDHKAAKPKSLHAPQKGTTFNEVK